MAYATVADVRSAGLTDTAVYPDVAVEAAITLWSELVDRATRQWFEARELTLDLDGTDSDTLHLAVPIITVDELYLNNAFSAALDTSHYRVYNATSYPDDRRNPRIKLRTHGDETDIFTAPIQARQLKFRKGRQNQRVVGSFGFVESDGSTPAMITRAVVKLVIEKLTTPIYVPAGSLPPVPVPPIVSGLITEEWTDGHKIKYADVFKTIDRRPSALDGITRDPEIRDILRMYRSPLAIGAPANPTRD